MILLIETIKMVGKVFRSNKLRTFLTMLGIIVGISSVTIILAVSEGAKQVLSDEFEAMDQTTLTVNFQDSYDNQTGVLSAKTIPPYESLQRLVNSSKVIKNVSVSSPRVWQEVQDLREQQALEDGVASNQTRFEDEDTKQVNAIGYDYFGIKGKVKEGLIAGRLFTAFDEQNQAYFTVISEDEAIQKFGSPKLALNRRIMINHMEYKIIGVVSEGENSGDGPWSEGYVYPAYILHATTSAQLEVNQMYPEEYIVKVDSTKHRDLAKREIQRCLNDFLVKDQYYINMGYGGNQEATNNIMDLITMVFAGIAGLSLVVGGIGIMNIMLVSVNERIKEIGIRQAIGAKRWHILMQFLVESIILTLLAGAIGMLLAQLMVSWLNSGDFGITLYVNIKVMIAVTLFCALVGIIFGYYPAHKASKLNIADSLRYE